MTSTTGLQLNSLVSALTWDETCIALAFEWKSSYVQMLRERFAATTKADASGLLAQATELMDQNELEGLLLSPRVAWRLLRDLEPDTVNAFKIEVLRVLDEEEKTNGDENENCLERGCIRLAGLLVDARSSYDCPSREPGEPALAHLPVEAEVPVFTLIEDAIDLLKCRAPNVHHFVRRMTTRVVIRSDNARPSSFASGSFSGHAGLTLLANPQVLKGDALRLIDAVVHESVHAAIYMYEPLEAPLCRLNPHGQRVRSCWSGRMLTLDQYVQACFVWWGLLNIWRTWLIRRRDQQAEKLLERAARGFSLRPALTLRQKIDTSYLDKRTWEALFAIEEQATMKAELPH